MAAGRGSIRALNSCNKHAPPIRWTNCCDCLHEPDNNLGPEDMTTLRPALEELKGLTNLDLRSTCAFGGRIYK